MRGRGGGGGGEEEEKGEGEGERDSASEAPELLGGRKDSVLHGGRKGSRKRGR